MDTALHSCLQTYLKVRQRPQVAVWLAKLRDHDPRLLEHSLLSGAMASIFARVMALNSREEELLVTGALLHDVGELGTPVTVLRKAGRLAMDERQAMEEHPTKGLYLLLDEDWDPEVLEMVYCHHEKLDGSGYPHGLQSGEVGRLVRMLTLCDIFCALIKKRSYRPSHQEPLGIMLAMESKLDRMLLREFAHAIPLLVDRTQRILQLEDNGGVFADSFLSMETQRIA
jgi:putative nucleotidyltransferase with HDIG domain